MLNKPVGYQYASEDKLLSPPSQRLHLILLGVSNIQKATHFYEALGWTQSPTSNDGFVKFNLGGYALCLIPRQDFAKDALYDSSKGEGFSGIGLVYLAKTPEEVPLILNRAVELGGTLVKPATRTHWGIAGYFKDLDGHLFEVDYEEAWVFDRKHGLVVDQVNNQ